MAWKDYEIGAMKRALRLAGKGRGLVEPNPMVGTVIVAGRRIVGQGFHHRFGGPHAEVVALGEAQKAARGAEVFVTLEPCCHFGKTPPCTDALIAAGVKRVVAAMKDPDPRVAGKGFAKLRRAGVAVEVGLLRKDAERLNAPYVKLRTTGLPWVTAKYAMTADGRIATASGDSQWISCKESRKAAHQLLRGRSDAIVVGIGTVLADDPILTARPRGLRVATRIVLDSKARTPLDSRLVATAKRVPLLVAVSRAAPAHRVKALRMRGAEVVTFGRGGRVDVRALAIELGRREMTHVLVEGGASVLGSFFGAHLVDTVVAFIAPKIVGEGLGTVKGWEVSGVATALALDDLKVSRIGRDVMITGRVRYPE